MWDQDLMSGAAKVTQDVVSLVVQQDVLNLPTRESHFIQASQRYGTTKGGKKKKANKQ